MIRNDDYFEIIKEQNKELAKFRPFTSAYEMKKEIERLNNIIKDIKDYVNFLVIYNQTINGKFSETQWGQDILDLIGSDKE